MGALTLTSLAVLDGAGASKNKATVDLGSAKLADAVVLSDKTGNEILWTDSAGRPAGAQQFADSSFVTNGASITLTIAPPAGKRVFIEGINIRWQGATAVANNNITLTNIDNLGAAKTLNYDMYVPAGITVAGQNISERFSTPLQGSAVDAVVVLTIPAPGAGNVHLSASIWGFCV